MNQVTVSIAICEKHWKKNGTNRVRLRVSMGGKTRFVCTPFIVHRKEVGSNDRILNKEVRCQAEDYQRVIENKIARINPFDLQGMSLENVIEYINKDDRFHLDFLAYARQIAAGMNGTSRSTYTCAINSFQLFVQKDEMPISEVSSTLMRKWEKWLKNKYGERARTVSSYPHCIQHIHNLARLEFNNEETGDCPIKNPFLYYTPPGQGMPKRGYKDVKPAVIQQMIDMRHELTGRERLGVDVFLISFCLMGMNAPDLFECVCEEGDILHYFRAKTRGRRDDRAEMFVRMEPIVWELMRDYASTTSGVAFDFSQRYATYQILGENVNRGLKKYCKRVNIKDNITLYSARHSWASIAYNNMKVDRYTINDCLGHKSRDLRMTEPYIHRQWKPLWEANKKVLKKFRW